MPTRLLRTALLAGLAILAGCDPAAEDDPNATFNISASITGLQGTLTLFNSGVGIIAVTGSGNVTIATHVLAGSPYNITIAHQPYGQNCTLANGSGTAGSDMSTVEVNCTAPAYPVTFSVSGLNGDAVLTNNGFDPITVGSDGTYTFPASAGYGDPYSVALVTEPVGHACAVTGGSGTATGRISGIQVQCVAVDPMMIREVSITATAPKFLRIDWQQVPAATHYRLMRDTDGIAGGALVQVGGNTTNTFATDRVSVHLRTKYIYVVEACDALHCVASVPADTTGMLSQAIGYLKADRVSGYYFGWRSALSSDGQTLAVGSTGLGSYAFFRGASDWTQQARFSVTTVGTSDPMGLGVALSADGRTLALTENSGRGRVRVYVRDTALAWSEQAILSAGADVTGLGAALAISANGNTLAVGATGLASENGRVFVYGRTGTTWTQQSELTASNPAPNAYFSGSLAMAGDGNTLVVGASNESSAGSGINASQTLTGTTYESGAAYVFIRSGATWVQQAFIKPTVSRALTYFGKSVSLSYNGNVLAVGAPGDNNSRTGINPANDSPTLQYSGATYVYARAGTTWTQQAYIKAWITDANDNFGHAVALSGDGRTLAVGAPYEDSAGNDMEAGMSANNASTNSGAAYLFTRPGTAWKQHRYIKAPINDSDDRFGYSVSLSADAATLAVGAIYESGNATGINGIQGDNSAQYSGAVYLY